MNFIHHNLPLEYPPKEMLRIYRDRLLVFSGVVMANLILLALVVFALSEPGIFVVAMALIGAFVVVCWWSSRDAALVKLGEGFKEKSLDVAGDAEAVAAIWALLGVSRAVAAPRHHKVSVRLGPLVLREVLDGAKRFHGDVVGDYCHRVAKSYDTQSEKGAWLRLAGMCDAIVDQIETAIETTPAEDLRKDMRLRRLPRGEVHEELSFWLFANRFIRDREGLRKICDTRPRSMFDVRPTRSYEGPIVAQYVTSSPGVWEFFSRQHLTSQTVEQIRNIMSLAEELSDELLKVKGDSIQGNNQDEKN